MIDLIQFEKNIKSGKVENCYIFCGHDENLIKHSIKLIVKNTLPEGESDFNYSKFDGEKVEYGDIYNSCETLPFMCSKKVVVVYRANFLRDDNKTSESLYKSVSKYLNDINPKTILILYYVFENNREKESRKVKNLGKKCTLVKVDKLKGMTLQKKVKDMFEKKGKKIEKSELTYFCNIVDNNLEVIQNEMEKLISYTEGREITKGDIDELVPTKSENDIFNLVDFLSQKRVKMAVDVYNQLIFKGEKATSILRMIQRQYKLLLNIKIGVNKGKTAQVLSKELSLHPYICEKMINQSRKFSMKSIQKILELSLKTEKRIKSSSSDVDIEIEMFMINTIRA